MTYLELANAVLVRLREPAVNTISQSDYSAMVGLMVNDAKRIVEDAWDWMALRQTVEIETASGNYTYALTGAGSRGKILDAINATTKIRLQQDAVQRFNNHFRLADPPSGTPSKYILRGQDANGDPAVELYPIPNGSYTLKFDMVIRQADLENDDDALLVPTQPVMQLALAMATRERGETGGTSAQEQFSIANTVLADAIALDAGSAPHELIWTS